MTAYNELIFNDRARGFLKEVISNTDTTLLLQDGGLLAFLQGWESGKDLYVTLLDATRNYEVVKVTNMARILTGEAMTVERGQDGTTARAWNTGTLIAQRLTAANYTRFLQKGIYRTISYNPNGIITALYPDEKLFQYDTVTPCYAWWKSKGGGTQWQLIAGELCPNWYTWYEWEAGDIYVEGEYDVDLELFEWVVGPCPGGHQYGTLQPEDGEGWQSYALYFPTWIRITYSGDPLTQVVVYTDDWGAVLIQANPITDTAYELTGVPSQTESSGVMVAVYLYNGTGNLTTITDIKWK